MLRKQVNPKTVVILMLLILAVVQGVYWRLLVYREPPGPPGRMGGGGGPGVPDTTQGYDDLAVETLTGDNPGYLDGPVWQARFSGPNALALSRDGTLYVADSRNHRIRAISPSGKVSTVVGGGGPAGNGGKGDGPATEPRFRYPSGVAVGTDGSLYVADTGNNRVCRVRNGKVTTLAAAPLRFPAALTLDRAGMLWVADVGAGVVRKIAPNGIVSTPSPTPPAVALALGELRPARVRPTVLAPKEGVGLPVPTKFQVERRSPGVMLGKWRFYADPDYHVLMGDGPVGKAVLVAGRRVAGIRSASWADGEGGHSAFAGPCALIAAPGSVLYLAEYEGNRIRRIHVPDWMLTGDVPPTRAPGRPPNGR